MKNPKPLVDMTNLPKEEVDRIMKELVKSFLPFPSSTAEDEQHE